LEPALRALAARERRALDDHPTPETLVAYRAGELPSEAAEALRDHLALCPDCAEMLLDLATFEQFTPSEESAGLTDGDVGAAWQRMQQRLAPVVEMVDRVETPEAAPVVAQEKEPEPLPFVPRASEYEPVVLRRKLRTAYAMAAVLAGCVVGLTVWGMTLKGQVRASSTPERNVHLVDAFQDGNRGAEETVPAIRGKHLLYLHIFGEIPQAPEYGAEVRDPAGVLILRASGLVPVQEGVFSMRLPVDQLVPGTYHIAFFGVTGGQWQKLDTLSFQAASPDH
jgi:anti-sigma factor ChrR (cupin superfamily)